MYRIELDADIMLADFEIDGGGGESAGSSLGGTKDIAYFEFGGQSQIIVTRSAITRNSTNVKFTVKRLPWQIC